MTGAGRACEMRAKSKRCETYLQPASHPHCSGRRLMAPCSSTKGGLRRLRCHESEGSEKWIIRKVPGKPGDRHICRGVARYLVPDAQERTGIVPGLVLAHPFSPRYDTIPPNLFMSTDGVRANLCDEHLIRGIGRTAYNGHAHLRKKPILHHYAREQGPRTGRPTAYHTAGRPVGIGRKLAGCRRKSGQTWPKPGGTGPEFDGCWTLRLTSANVRPISANLGAMSAKIGPPWAAEPRRAHATPQRRQTRNSGEVQALHVVGQNPPLKQSCQHVPVPRMIEPLRSYREK